MLTLTPQAWKWVDPSQRIFAGAGRRVDLTRFKPANDADYVWYFGKYQPERLPEGGRVLYRTKHSVLVQIVRPPAPAAQTVPPPSLAKPAQDR